MFFTLMSFWMLKHLPALPTSLDWLGLMSANFQLVIQLLQDTADLLFSARVLVRVSLLVQRFNLALISS